MTTASYEWVVHRDEAIGYCKSCGLMLGKKDRKCPRCQVRVTGVDAESKTPDIGRRIDAATRAALLERN